MCNNYQPKIVFRFFCVTLIQGVGTKVKAMPQRAITTACHIFQTFYCYANFEDYDVRHVAAGALALASKSEECRMRLTRSFPAMLLGVTQLIKD